MKNFGLIIDEHRPTDYHRDAIIGTVQSPLVKGVFFSDGHGIGNFLVDPEIQKSDFVDWMDCVTESAINCVQTLLKIQGLDSYKFDYDKSKRFTATMSHTTVNGNSQYNVAQSVKNDGTVEEKKWDRNRSMSWNSYYSMIPQAIINLGKEFLKDIDIKYEWISTTPQGLKEALKHGPVQVIGAAWAQRNGLYYSFGPANHAFMLFDYVEGEKWRIYDSYPTDFMIDDTATVQEFIKELEWDFNFENAIQFVVTPKTQKKTLFLTLKNMLDNIWAYFDSHGMHAFFVKKDNGINKKVEIDLNDPQSAIRALYVALNEKGAFKTSSWPELSAIADKKWF